MGETIRDPTSNNRLVINTDGSINVVIIGSTPNIENKVGSDCNGSSGAINRVLTLTNTSTSTNELVVIDGLVLYLAEGYTVSHLGASSTITFLAEVFDEQKIRISYFT